MTYKKDLGYSSLQHHFFGALATAYLMTGLDGKPSSDTPWTHSRRGSAHRSRRTGKEEGRRLMFLAISISSYARTVPGPASLGSDSTATSVPMVDGSNAEERQHRFRSTTTICQYVAGASPYGWALHTKPQDTDLYLLCASCQDLHTLKASQGTVFSLMCICGLYLYCPVRGA